MFQFLRIIRFLVVVVLLLRATAWVAASVCAIVTPNDVYWLESKMIYLAREVQHDRTLYPDWSQFPYESNFYGPVYFVFVGRLAKAVHLQEFGLRTMARVVSELSVFLTAGLVGFVVHRETRGLGGSWIASLSLMASAPMIGFGHMARPDVPAVALGWAGVCAYYYGKTWKSQVFSIVLLALGTLTKQTMVVPILALVCWQVVRREYRKALTLLAGWLLIAIVLILACTRFWFPRCMIDMLAAGSDPFGAAFGLFTLQRVLIYMPDVVLVLVVAPFGLLRLLHRESIFPFGLLIVCWNVFGSFKCGSDLNYFLDTAILGSICIGILWNHNSDGPRSLATPSGSADPRQSVGQSFRERLLARPNLTSIFWIMFLVLAGNVPLRWQMWYLGLRVQEASHRRARDPRLSSENMIVGIMRSQNHRVLTDSPYLALQSYHQPPFVDTFLFRRLVMDDRVRPVELLRRIRSREYDFVFSVDQISSPGYDDAEFCFPPVVASAIAENYVLLGRMGGVLVYRPMGEISPSIIPP